MRKWKNYILFIGQRTLYQRDTSRIAKTVNEIILVTPSSSLYTTQTNVKISKQNKKTTNQYIGYHDTTSLANNYVKENLKEF